MMLMTALDWWKAAATAAGDPEGRHPCNAIVLNAIPTVNPGGITTSIHRQAVHRPVLRSRRGALMID